MKESAWSSLRGRDIVCVGFADWDTPLWTNQHHLMSRLAQHNRVLFIESLGLRRPQFAGRDLRRMARRLRRGLAGTRRADGLDVLAPLVLPLHTRRWARTLNGAILRRLVGRTGRRLGLEAPILWAYVPQAEVLLDVIDPSQVVYHCVDDIAAQQGVDAPSFRSAENRFARRADLVLASAPALAARMRRLNPHVLYAPNVADTALFAQALSPGPVDPALDRLPRPRVVFTGAIAATKLDLRLLDALAQRRPDWTIALVGPVGEGDPATDVSTLAARPNVQLLGVRRYRDLPAVLRGADVGIIPYAINALTSSIFPMKVYEYMAAGLPVVATPLPALDGVPGVETADGAAEMAARIEAVITANGPEQRRARSTRAAAHSWDARVAEIADALAK